MEHPEEIRKFACYNALNRNGLIGGVPIITLVIICALMLFTGIAGALLFGDFRAAIVPGLLALGLLFIKIICTDNSRAMESLWWDIKGAVFKIRCGSSVASFSSSSDSQKQRKVEISEWFKNNLNG